MDGGIEQTLPPALRGLPVARVFLDVRDETRVEDGFAVTPGTGCGFLKAGEFGCKPPLSLDSRDRRKDAPRKIVRSAQTQITTKSHYQCRLLAILTSRQSD